MSALQIAIKQAGEGHRNVVRDPFCHSDDSGHAAINQSLHQVLFSPTRFGIIRSGVSASTGIEYS